MKRSFILFSILGIFFAFQADYCFSQKEFNNWYFGMQAGVTFNSGSPVALSGSGLSTFGYGASDISDSLGNILFYTNGAMVYNRNNLLMPYGAIGGNACGYGYARNVAAFRWINNPNKFYLFSAGCHQAVNLSGLRYSVIDMTLDGGLGDVVNLFNGLPVPYASSARTAVTATRQHNNKDVWMVVRLQSTDSNYYASYAGNSAGMNFNPVFSNSHLQLYNSPSLTPVIMSLRFSRNGLKLVAVYDTIIEYCSFNTATGQVTPQFLVLLPMCGNYHIIPKSAEFSIESHYLYVSGQGTGTCPDPKGFLFQFDATITDSASFANSAVMISNETHIPGLQMAPDGKIYGSTGVIDSLSVINNPSSQGPGCNYQRDVLELLGHISGYSLPDFVERYYALIHVTGQCPGQAASFTSVVWPPADSIHWDFGDPASGTVNYSNLPDPSHSYSLTGTYTVELFVRHIDQRTDTTWLTVNVLPNPHPSLGPDRIICIGDSTTFDAGACTGCTYIWKDLGSGLTVGTTRTFRTNQPGTYEAIVTDANGCNGSDTVQMSTTQVPIVSNFPLSKTICTGQSTDIHLLSNVSGTTFHWTCTLTSGNVTGYSADSGLVINQVLVNPLSTAGIVTYHITPRFANCLGVTVDFPVTVNPGDSVKLSISASGNNICTGTSVTFTATPNNGGSSPSYQWKVNGANAGTNSTIFTYVPVNNDAVKCVLTSSNTICVYNNPATSNTITMTVNPNLVVSVSVGASQNPFCAGGSVTFTATPTNGGIPQYQWKVNGTNVGGNSNIYTFNPLNGDQVMCIMNSSIPCPLNNPAASNTITMTENTNLPAGVSITAIPNPFCPGTTVNYTATPVYGGPSPTYQWKVNGTNQGTNSASFSYAPLAGDSIRCVITSNLPCVTNNPASSVKIIMSSLPAPVISFPYCFDSITTITAVPFILKGGIQLGGTYSGPGVNSVTAVFTPSIAGVGTKTITYSYTNVSLCTAIMTKNIIVQAAPVFSCGNNFTDIRDNKVYPTIQLGAQCWMQKNLNYGIFIQGTTGQTDNCLNEKYCYSDNAVNCTLYGGLYQWDEVMAYTNTPGAQGLCPPGWHIPTQAEWMTLFNANLTQGMAGKPLQDSIFNGFRAKESGVDYSNLIWKFQGFATIYWSSNSYGTIKALSHGMNLQNFGVSDYYSNRSNAFAVRCLKN